MEPLLINYSEPHSFTGMLEKISKDSALSFLCNKELYFMKFDKVVKCPLNNRDTVCDYDLAVEVTLNKETLNGTFYETSTFVSDVIMEIGLEQVRDCFLDEKIIMMVANGHTWIMYKEDNAVVLDYEEIPEVDDNNFRDYFTEDIMNGILEGVWYIINED